MSNIYITEMDKERLTKIMYDKLSSGKVPEKSMEKLEYEIDKATVVNSRQIPQNIITMNSRVLLYIDDEELEVALVYPNDADLNSNKMSILSPIGTAILGYKEGDIVEWEVPDGVTKIHIKKVLYQPEAVGDYNM